MAARGKHTQRGGQHQPDEQQKPRHGVACHHLTARFVPLTRGRSPTLIYKTYISYRVRKAPMRVQRMVKSGQTALQRVARPPVRSTPTARRTESLTEQAYR